MAILSTKISSLEEVVRQKDIVIAEQGDHISKQFEVILNMKERLRPSMSSTTVWISMAAACASGLTIYK